MAFKQLVSVILILVPCKLEIVIFKWALVIKYYVRFVLQFVQTVQHGTLRMVLLHSFDNIE